MISQYRYTDPEQKQLLKTLRVIVDTREQQNEHITGYFTQKGISYISRALSFGDYSYFLPAYPGILDGVAAAVQYSYRVRAGRVCWAVHPFEIPLSPTRTVTGTGFLTA